MKIILATGEQFRQIWEHSLPAMRDGGGVPHPVIIMRHLDTMIVLRDGVEFGSIEAFTDAISLKWLSETIAQRKYFEVG